MRLGIVVLVLAYGLSQFYRAFLAVLTPALGADLGMEPADLARASGVWFAVFAAAQIPVGLGLDRLGPRRVAATLFLVGAGGGAAVFALAASPAWIVAAMALIGLGCAPVLMSMLYIFARIYSPAAFASLAGLVIGLASIGNLVAAAPMALAADAFGWRGAMAGIAVFSVAVGLMLLAVVRDPPPAPAPPAESTAPGGLGALLRTPALWAMAPLVLVNYAPAAGVRGLWAGPYLRETFGLDADGIGTVTLVMAAAMILGNFAYGPADRLLRTRKWTLVAGNLLAGGALILLGLTPDRGVGWATALLAALGFFGASFPLVMAHVRSYCPPHLVGRGVSFANMLAIGTVGLLQFGGGRLYGGLVAGGAAPAAAFGTLFTVFGALLALGAAVYVLAEDRLD
ncbi:MFS transporter [Amaricoccus sp.]|uniref:MFS transporter n=1 Tax=Amaricoccus sp. TaxID=1872485 RepID=UPI001B73B812|nr:MFS transporter [Amaricoccus sp.]MBP7000111.1 MFS transporter [Amaricoccus sp.]